MPIDPHRSRLAVLLAGALCLAAPPADADELNIEGTWLSNVQVLAVEAGEVSLLLPNGAEVTRSLGSVQGVRLVAYPQLAEAEQALAEGDDRTAVRLLGQVRDAAREPWVRQWATYQLLGPLDRQGGTQASELYLELATQRVPYDWVSRPPTASAARLTDDQKATLRAAIDAARARAGEELSFELDTLADAAGAGAEDGAGGAEAGGSVVPDWTTGGSAVALPLSLQDSRELTLLRRGRFNEAVEMLDADLAREASDRSMAERLYLHGHALLGVAESTGEPDDFRKAAMSFMRVAIYFQRHSLAMPALLEAAYCHHRFDAQEDAASLYRAYESLGGVDADNEPDYAARAATIAAALGLDAP